MPEEYAHPDEPEAAAQGTPPDEYPGKPWRIGPGKFLDLILPAAGDHYLVTLTGAQGVDGNGKPKLVEIDQRSWPAGSGRDAVVAYCSRQSEAERDVYVGVHLYREPDSRKKDNAADEVAALWCDTDGAELPESFPEPNLRVESSPGREHLYWLLEEPILAEEAAQLNRRIAYAMAADIGKWGLGTVLRVPETSNYKREEPTPVTARLFREDRYAPETLNASIPAAEDVLPGARRRRERRDRAAHSGAALTAAGEPPVRLLPADREAWDGTRTVAGGNGSIDRSRTLHWIGCGVARGLRRAEISEAEQQRIVADAVEERDASLGYHKYTGRDDRGERYAELADEAVAEAARDPWSDPAKNGVVAQGGGPAKPPAPGGGVKPTPSVFPLTDYGNAERLVARHGEDLRYVYPWSKWLIWDGRRWRVDDTGELGRRAKETARSIYAEAAAEPDDGARKALAAHARKTEASGRLEAMTALARSESGIPVRPADLDTDPWSMNVANGTLDLRAGVLREHRREDLITRLAPVEYHPDATAPLWEQTLERILPGPELREFVQRYLGYSLTGDVSEQCLAIAHGIGANGKTTLIDAVMAVMGEYAIQGAPDLLIAKRDAHPTELADLHGRRLVSTVEVEQGRRLAESRVKQLTGGDRVRARRMKEDFWEFEPTHKFMVATNHKPQVLGTDHGIWRRIKLIPFSVTIPAGERDEGLPQKLAAERPGILAWLVRGCLAWQRGGLREPREVTDATEHYRAEMDTLAAWISDCCVESPDAWARLKNLYDSYVEWCSDSHESPETKRRFSSLLTERGFGADKGTGNVAIRRGIGLRSGPEDDGPDGGANDGTRRRTEAPIVTQDPPESGPGADPAASEPGDGAPIVTQAHLADESENPCKEAQNEGIVTQRYPGMGVAAGNPTHERLTHIRDNSDNLSNPEPSSEGSPGPDDAASEGPSVVRRPPGDAGAESGDAPGTYFVDDRPDDARAAPIAPREGDWLPGWEPGSERGGEYGCLRGESPRQKAARMHAELGGRGDG